MRMIKFRDPNDTTKEDMNKFWNIFIQWISYEQIRRLYFSEEYKNSTNANYDSNLKFYNEQYILYYAREYPFFKIANYGIDEAELKDFLNINYNKWIMPEKRDLFAIEVNKQLRRAGLSYLLPVNDQIEYKENSNDDILLQMKFINNPAVRKELLDDLITILALMQGNINYKGKKENILNDGVRDGLKITKRYQVHDQSRHGESESGVDAGELDLLVSSKKEDLPIAVVEALILNGMDRTNLGKHINKALTKYDPNGCPITFILIYSRNDDFAKLSTSISEYLNSYQYPYEVKDAFEELSTGYTESRHWKLDLIRSNKDITVHILDFNMP